MSEVFCLLSEVCLIEVLVIGDPGREVKGEVKKHRGVMIWFSVFGLGVY